MDTYFLTFFDLFAEITPAFDYRIVRGSCAEIWIVVGWSFSMLQETGSLISR